MAAGAADNVLEARIVLRDELAPGLDKARKALGDFSKGFEVVNAAAKKAFAVLTGGFLLLGRAAFQTADELQKLSDETGVSVTNLQKLGVAAKASGTGLKQMAVGLRQLSSLAVEAADGSAEARHKFEELGIGIYDASGNLKTAEGLFDDFADAIAKTTNPTERLAMATRMLGRGGADLIPMLSQGSRGMRELGDTAQRAGLLMSKETVKALDTFGDQLTATKDIFVALLGTWLANTQITVPKLIDAFGTFAKSVNVVKLLIEQGFKNIVDLGKFLYNGLSAWFTATVEAGKLAFGKMAGTVEPFVSAVTAMLTALGVMSEETADKIRNVFLEMGAKSSGRGALDPFKTALQETEAATEVFKDNVRQNLDDFNKGVEDSNAVIEQFGADVKKVMGQDVPQAVDDGTKSSREKLKELEQSFTGGLGLALKDLAEKLPMNMRAAWGKVFETMQEGFSTAFADMTAKGESFKSAFRKLTQDLKYSFLKMIGDMISSQLMKQLGGALGGIFPGMAGGGGGGRPAVATPGAGGSPAAGMPAAAAAGGGDFGLFNWGFTPGGTGEALMGIGQGVGIAGGAALMQQGQAKSNSAMTIGGAAMMGAAVGAVAGPIGAVAGALIGAAYGVFSSNRQKAQQKKAEERAEEQRQQAEAEYQKLLDQAKVLVKGSVRQQFGGGLGTPDAVAEISQLFSGDISNEEVEAIGRRASVGRPIGAGGGNNQYDVGGIHIAVNAQVSGAYDVDRLGAALAESIQSKLTSALASRGPI